MHIMLRITTAAAALAFAAGAAQAKDWTTVRIAMDATYPPFESLDPSGEIVGFEKDIADALCERMKVTCEFTNQAWEGIIPGLLANKYDAILSSMSITEERKQQVDFTDKIYNTPPAIAVPKDSDAHRRHAGGPDRHHHRRADLDDARELRARRSSPTPSCSIYPSPDEYKLDLANGRLDAAIDDVVVLDEWIKSEEGACCRILGVLPTDPVINGDGAGIAHPQGGHRPQGRCSTRRIDEIRADGTYKTINDKYFAFDVYGS